MGAFRLLFVTSCLLGITSAMGQSEAVKSIPKVAILWTYAENEKGTSEAGIRISNDLINKLFEQKAGFEIVSPAIAKAAWSEVGLQERPLTVEELGQLPAIPEAKTLLEFGKKAGVDYVCVGTLGWRVRSMWVGLGPKTKADATVSVVIVDVNKREVVLDAKDVNSDSTRAEKWYESAGSLLVSWGFTLFSGGPKTPHIQKSAVKAIGAATDPFFSASNRKI